MLGRRKDRSCKAGERPSVLMSPVLLAMEQTSIIIAMRTALPIATKWTRVRLVCWSQWCLKVTCSTAAVFIPRTPMAMTFAAVGKFGTNINDRKGLCLVKEMPLHGTHAIRGVDCTALSLGLGQLQIAGRSLGGVFRMVY